MRVLVRALANARLQIVVVVVVSVVVPAPFAAQPHALHHEQDQQARQGRHPRTRTMRHGTVVVAFVDLAPRQVRQ